VGQGLTAAAAWAPWGARKRSGWTSGTPWASTGIGGTPGSSWIKRRGWRDGRRWGASFYLHQRQTSDIIYSCIRRAFDERNRYSAPRRDILSGLSVGLFEFSRFLRRHPLMTSASLGTSFRVSCDDQMRNRDNNNYCCDSQQIRLRARLQKRRLFVQFFFTLS